MGAIASQIISLTIVYSVVYSSADQRKHQSSASLTGEFPAQMTSNAEMFPFDDAIMICKWGNVMDYKVSLYDDYCSRNMDRKGKGYLLHLKPLMFFSCLFISCILSIGNDFILFIFIMNIPKYNPIEKYTKYAIHEIYEYTFWYWWQDVV